MASEAAESFPVRYGPTTTAEWISRIPNHTYNRRHRENEDNLPEDPRQWTRDHVVQWLNFVTRQHGLPQVAASRFVMNGKALCLMSPSMFLSRVPLGGKLLYKDFQLRLCAALYSEN